MNVAIGGIHTGIGKTVCSAVLCQAFGFDYWKPVQAGELDQSDSKFISQYVTNPACVIHPEQYKLQQAISPHAAARAENIQINITDFHLPSTNNSLIVETAGGLMSPLSDNFLNVDLIQALQLSTVLVSNNYLGSINHTLLSAELLKTRKIDVLGIVFVGNETASSEEFILRYTGLPKLFSIPLFDKINSETIGNFVRKNNITLPIR
ncbi:MAG: dethiobiotin synthase [Bacteroidetes bacterium]|nr:dethiobiotin synthase [Bacteroidota bacterium]MBS1541547.1 dethiobiotin synthase [Bacteroidota bacterium]